AVSPERDLALLRILSQIRDEETALAQRDLLPGWDDDLALRDVDGELDARERKLGVAGVHGRHLGQVGDAHTGNVELDVYGVGRKCSCGLNFREVAWRQAHVELAASDLAASDPLQHPSPRFAR